MGGRRAASRVGASPQAVAPFRLSEALRAKALLTPDEVADALGVTRKEVYALPIPRQQITPKKARYRVEAVEAYVQGTTRPQGIGFLMLASRHMDRGALTAVDVARLLRVRRESAVAFMAPATRLSLAELEARLSAVTMEQGQD